MYHEQLEREGFFCIFFFFCFRFHRYVISYHADLDSTGQHWNPAYAEEKAPISLGFRRQNFFSIKEGESFAADAHGCSLCSSSML